MNKTTKRLNAIIYANDSVAIDSRECCICYEKTKYKTSSNHSICISCSDIYSKNECPYCRTIRKDVCYYCSETTRSCVCYVKYLFDDKQCYELTPKQMLINYICKVNALDDYEINN